jgi:hypothetical protein
MGVRDRGELADQRRGEKDEPDEAPPCNCMVSLRLSRWLARHARPALSRIVATRPGRVLVLGQMLALRLP